MPKTDGNERHTVISGKWPEQRQPDYCSGKAGRTQLGRNTLPSTSKYVGVGTWIRKGSTAHLDAPDHTSYDYDARMEAI